MNINGNVKKVIVTGANGQTGSYMVEYLLKNTNYKIIGTIRRTSQLIDSNLRESLKNPRFKLAQLQLTDAISVQNLIEKENPDYFINFGGQTFVADSWNNPVEYIQTNSISLIYILEAIKKYVPYCRIYSSGSSEQFGNVKYSPQDEQHPMSPRSIYGVSKCAASHICKIYRESYGMYIVHGILFNHESPRRQEYFVTRKITKAVGRINKALKFNQTFESLELGNIYSKRDWSDVEDVVDAVWKMLNQELYNYKLIHSSREVVINNLKEYVVSSGESHTIKEFVDTAFEIAGISGVWEFEGLQERYRYNDGCGNDYILVKINPSFYRPAEVDSLCGNSTLIRKELGWNPKTTFKELVRKMVAGDL